MSNGNEEQFREMLEKKVDIAHWASHTANEEILKSVISELQAVGYVISKDINLTKRLEFFQCIKNTTMLKYSDLNSFERLLEKFDKLMGRYAADFEGKGIHMYRWLHIRDKFMLQIGLVVLYKHMKFRFTDLPNAPSDLVVSASWNAGNYEGELKSRLGNNASKYKFKPADKEMYDSSFQGRVFSKLTNFIQKGRKVDIMNLYDLFYENQISTFVRDCCAFTAEMEKNALMSPHMVITSYHSEPMGPEIKTESGVTSNRKQNRQRPYDDSVPSSQLYESDGLPPLPIQPDGSSNASSSATKNRDKSHLTSSKSSNKGVPMMLREIQHYNRPSTNETSTGKRTRSVPSSPLSPKKGSRREETDETAEENASRLREARNILKKSDEIDPLNDIAIDTDLPETRATVGTKNGAKGYSSSENVNTNARLSMATTSSRVPNKSLGGPRPGAVKVSPADSDDGSRITDDIKDFEDDDDLDSERSHVFKGLDLNTSKPKKKNYPAKLDHSLNTHQHQSSKPAVGDRGGRRKWSLDEEEALINGYVKYSNDKELWSKIKGDPQFASTLQYRTNVQLKDKWRNLATSTSKP